MSFEPVTHFNRTALNNPYVNRGIRGLNRKEAASYIGVSPTSFDDLVKGGRMPKPVRIGSRTIWDVRALDSSFDDLAETAENPWDSVFGNDPMSDGAGRTK